MPQRKKTAMEKYRAGMTLTPSEEKTVQRILKRNRKAKINIGRKRSRGAAGMTLGEMKPKRKLVKALPKKLSVPKKFLLKNIIKRKPKSVIGSEEWNKKWRDMSNNQRLSAVTSNSEVKNWYDSRKKVRRTPRKKGKKNPVGRRPGKVKPTKLY